MLQLLKPELHGYVGAELDKDGNAIKITCDVLAVNQYAIDSQTAPMASIVVTYSRVDPDNNFKQGGPFTQHLIQGLEAIAVLEEPGGVTVESIEASTLRTGIPSAGIKPEDLAPYQSAAPTFNERLILSIKMKMEEIKKAEEAAMPTMPSIIPTPPPEIPMPLVPPVTEEPAP